MYERLIEIKKLNRAMQSYIFMLYEFILESKPNKVIEIGVQRGQSTRAMLFAMCDNDQGLLVSVDDKNRENLLTKWETYKYDLPQYWHFIQGDSHDKKTLDAVKDILSEGEMYDMMFIDGDHTYKGVKQDFEWYGNLIKPGGVIMLHDTSNRRAGVKEFWDEITWEKFNIDWGKAGSGVIPGFGICRKPK